MSSQLVWAQSTVFNKSYDYDGGAGIGTSVLPTDAGYIIIGSGWVKEFGGLNGNYFLTTTNVGQPIIFRAYGDSTYTFYADRPASLTKLLDGRYAYTATKSDSFLTEADGYLMIIDEAGDTIQKAKNTGPEWSQFHQCRQRTDGSFIVFGWSPKNNGDFHLLSYDTAGVLQWDSIYGGSQVEYTAQFDILPDGGYVMCGKTQSYGKGFSDGWIVRTDKDGKVLWSKTYGTEREECGIWSIKPTWDGGFIMAHCMDTTIVLGDNQYINYLAKLDFFGNVVWRSWFSTRDEIVIYQVDEFDDGSYGTVGYIQQKGFGDRWGWAAKLDPHGNKKWERLYYSRPDLPQDFRDMRPTEDGGMIITGTCFDMQPEQSIWLVKVDSNGYTCAYGDMGCDSITTSIEPSERVLPTQATIFPNPVQYQIQYELPQTWLGQSIQLLLYDQLGRLVRQTDLPSNSSYGQAPLTGLSNGLYMYQLKQGRFTLQQGKLTILH